MAEQLGKDNPQDHETRGQRIRRHFVHYYYAPLIIAMGVYTVGTFGIPEAQRVIRGDFGKITDTSEMEDLMSGNFRTITNLEGRPPLPDQTGGWLLDAYMGTGLASSFAALGYGIYLRIATRDRR